MICGTPIFHSFQNSTTINQHKNKLLLAVRKRCKQSCTLSYFALTVESINNLFEMNMFIHQNKTQNSKTIYFEQAI